MLWKLHFAPEQSIQSRLEQLEHLDYITADLYQPGVKELIDIMDIPYPDNTFDIIYCSHVLQHVSNDLKAISELYRVLKSGGWAIIQVPLSTGHTKERNQAEWPQIKLDEEYEDFHYRYYGDDFISRLHSASFQVRIVSATEHIPSEELARYGIPAESSTCFCCKE